MVGERNQAFVLGPIFTICLQLLRCIFQKWCQECSARLLLQCFFPQTSAGRRGSYLVCTETGLPVRISGRRGCQELLSPAANSLSVRISSRECCLELLIELPSPAANSLPYIYIYIELPSPAANSLLVRISSRRGCLKHLWTSALVAMLSSTHCQATWGGVPKTIIPFVWGPRAGFF